MNDNNINNINSNNNGNINSQPLNNNPVTQPVQTQPTNTTPQMVQTQPTNPVNMQPTNTNPEPVMVQPPKKKSVVPLIIVIVVGVILVGMVGAVAFGLKVFKILSTVNTNNNQPEVEVTPSPSSSGKTKNSENELTIIGEKMSNRLEEHVEAVIKHLDNMEVEAETDITANDISYRKNNDVIKVSSTDDEYYYFAYKEVYNQKTGLLIDKYYVRCQWDDEKQDIINYGDNVKYRKVEEIYEKAIGAVIFTDTKYWGDWVFDVSDEYDNYVKDFLSHPEELYMIFLDDVSSNYYNTYLEKCKNLAKKAKEEMMRSDASIQLYVINSGTLDIDTRADFIKEISDADRSPTALSITTLTDLIDKMSQKDYEVIK